MSDWKYEIEIKIKKSIISGNDPTSGYVSLTANIPCYIGLTEAKRFKSALGDAIEMAGNWQFNRFAAIGGKQLTEVKPEEKKFEKGPPPAKRGRPPKEPKAKEADDGGSMPELRGEDSLAEAG